MAVKYYKATYGPVTFITSTGFYEQCYDLDSGNSLSVDGEDTEDGEAFKEF